MHKSNDTVSRIPGLYILTATCSPVFLKVALYTYPMEAAATGCSVIYENTSSKETPSSFLKIASD